jgi:SAM-dependent methyltransferase
MKLMSNEGSRDFTLKRLLETVLAEIRPRRSNDSVGVEDLQRRLDPSELRRMCLYRSLIPKAVSPDARLVDIGGTVFWLPLYLSLVYQHITVVVRPGHGFFDEFELVRQREFTLEIVEADAELDPYPIEPGSATVVVCFEVLEHLAGDPMHLIAESNRILAADGSLCLVTPNVLWHQNVLNIIVGQHPFSWSVFTCSYADRHNREYTPFEVQWLLESGGYRVDDLHTVAFHKPHWRRRVLGRLLCMPAALTKRVSFTLREEVTLVHAQKIGPVKDRYPEFLYSLYGFPRVFSYKCPRTEVSGLPR